MGTVGLSFGSATSGQGFDVSSTVTSILAIQQGIETPWKNQLTTLKAQGTALSTIGTDLATLSTKLQALTDFDGVTAEKNGSSSDTSVLSLSSASVNATAGSHDVVVNSLAQTSSVYTNAVSASDALSGSITIQVGSGTAQTVSVDPNNATLSGLAAAINSAGIGVTASIVSDSNGARLSLVSATSGAAGQLTVTQSLTDTTTGSSLTTQVGHNGADASLTVDGIALSSSSNTVSTAIPGVTFQLLNVSSTPVQVEITNDTTDVASALSDFVTAYNTVAGDLNTQEGKDSSGDAEPLFGDPTLALLQQSLSSALIGGSASGSISSIAQLGISVNDDGTLMFSASDATDALNANFSDAVGFLQNAGSFGQNLTSVLNGLSSTATTGAIYLAQAQITSQETDLNNDVSNEETLLATEKTTLTTELNTANETLQSIPSQLSEVNEMYSAVTGYNSTNG